MTRSRNVEAPTLARVDRARIAVVPAAVSVALAAAGCGASQMPNRSASSSGATGVAFTACMRSHGVPDFPDPGPNGVDLADIDTRTPAFRSAHQSCAPLQPASSADSSSASESDRLAAIDNARCMRSRGVPNFPDPKFLASGGNTVSLDGLDTQSPAFKHAQAACPWGPSTEP